MMALLFSLESWLHLYAPLILSVLGWTAISPKEEHFQDSSERYLGSFSGARSHNSPSKLHKRVVEHADGGIGALSHVNNLVNLN